MPTPTVVNAGSTTVASGGTISIPAPASLVVGRILVAAIFTTTVTNTFVAPANWYPAVNGGAQVILAAAVFWHIVDGTEGGTFTFTWGSNSTAAGICVQTNGASSGWPIEVIAGQANASSANIIASAAVAKWNADLLLSFYSTNTANAITVPGGQSNVGGTTGNSKAIICGYEALAANGTTGTRTATGTAAINAGLNVLVREPSTIGTALLNAYFSVPILYAANYGTYGKGNLIGDMNRVGVWYGQFKVAGYALKDDGTLAPLVRNIFLTNDYGYTLRGTTTPAADGSFTFDNIPAGNYIVWGADPNDVQDAKIHAIIAAVAM